MAYAIGVVGATGQVGREFLRILEERDRPDLPIASVRLFASERSAGQRIAVRGDELVVERAQPDPRLFEGLDFVITAIGDEQARSYAPAIAQAGALDVDKSNAWRMDPSVPLVVPEVNPDDARQHRGIIAGPNCSTTQMVVALAPLHRANPIRRVIVDTYQAVSGTGWRAVDELNAQRAAAAADQPLDARVYPYPIHRQRAARDRQPQGRRAVQRRAEDGPGDAQDPARARAGRSRATCVRVPVAVGHSEAIHVELERPMAPDEARALLAAAPGVVVVDDPARSRYPMPIDAAGRDPVFVGRVRADPSHPNGLALWVVSDNLRKGAALNAVQVFELVAREGWLAASRAPALAGSSAE